MIERGRVTVDGLPAHIGQTVDPETARVEIDGVPLPVAPGLVHLLLYKPVGVVSTADDPQGRTTVVDLVAGDSRLYPVGRLDYDSEGLIILTNDGDLTNRLTHPRYGVERTYAALVDSVPTPADLRRLVEGVDLEDGPARAVRARSVARHGGSAMIEVVMIEGRNREVRRMMDAIGYPIRRLVRTGIGPIRDGRLQPGASRPLTMAEVRALYEASGAGHG
jgi:23S rRNA pseudouridine2605 synthase